MRVPAGAEWVSRYTRRTPVKSAGLAGEIGRSNYPRYEQELYETIVRAPSLNNDSRWGEWRS